MSATTVDPSPYSPKAVWRARLRVFLRRLAYGFLVLFCLILLGWGVCYFLANLPRERRAAGYSFLQRAKLGAFNVLSATRLTLNNSEDDPVASPLPKVELFLDGKSKEALISNLPSSGEVFQPAYIRVDGDAFQAEAKLRGDSINHWAFPQKSWRIKLRPGQLVDGMGAFNLNLPRSATQLENWMGNELARRMEQGLLTPFSEMVHFRFNRVFDGVRLFLEQPNEDFLTRNGLPQGKIYVGDISTEDIYTLNKRRKLLFDDLSAWELRGGGVGEAASKYEMEALFKVLNEKDPLVRARSLYALVDISKELAYMALLELVNSTHIDNTQP